MTSFVLFLLKPFVRDGMAFGSIRAQRQRSRVPRTAEGGHPYENLS